MIIIKIVRKIATESKAKVVYPPTTHIDITRQVYYYHANSSSMRILILSLNLHQQRRWLCHGSTAGALLRVQQAPASRLDCWRCFVRFQCCCCCCCATATGDVDRQHSSVRLIRLRRTPVAPRRCLHQAPTQTDTLRTLRRIPVSRQNLCSKGRAIAHLH